LPLILPDRIAFPSAPSKAALSQYAYDQTSQLTSADHASQADEAYSYDASLTDELRGLANRFTYWSQCGERAYRNFHDLLRCFPTIGQRIKPVRE